MSSSSSAPSFFARLGLAFRVLGDAALAGRVATLDTSAAPAQPAPKPAAPVAAPAAIPAEQTHAAALALLALLQREGRLVDFLQEDVSAYADADIGAAARVVHAGSRKVLQQYLVLEPALAGTEGDTVTVPVGFNAGRIRLTGNITGQPPFRGALKHHGWVAKSVTLPAVSPALDPRIIAPAEVEL
jgi:hypothetical protein